MELMKRRRILATAPRLATATGSVASFITDMALPLKKCEFAFLPVQAGTGDPSPSNVRPITGWTGVTAYKAGKNLFDKDNANVLNGYLSSSKVESSSLSKTIYIAVKPSIEYTISKCSSARFAVALSNSDTAPTVGTSVTNMSSDATWSYKTVRTNADTKWLLVWLYASNADTLTLAQILDTVQVEIGSPASTYAPYTGTTIPVTFPTQGTNLFDEQWEQGDIQQGTEQPSTAALRSGFINVSPSTSYYGYTTRTANVYVFEYTEDGTYANKVNVLATSRSFTTGASTKKIRIVDRNSGTETVNTGINYPVTATSYEPYTNTVYGGTLDLVSGVLTAETVEASAVLSTYSNKYNGTTYDLYVFNDFAKSDIASGGQVCNIAPYLVSSGQSLHFYISDNKKLQIYLPKDIDLTQTVEATYKLATPVTYQLTPQQITALKGQNNVFSDVNGNTTVKYWKH